MSAGTTPPAMSEREVTRYWCASSLLNYTRYFFRAVNGSRFLVWDFHRTICEALERVIKGETQYLMVNIPPRHGKTEMVSKAFIGYALALNPRAQFITVSYSDDLVLNNSRNVNELLRSEEHRRLFPECDVQNVGSRHWTTSAGGSVYAVSTGGQITGFGAGAMLDPSEYPEGLPFSGALIIDDPIKPADALSDVVRASVNARFENTIRNRRNSADTPIIIIMQRLHEDDLCGYLLRKEGRKEEGGRWEVVSIPALSVDEQGNEVALCPPRVSVEELHRIASDTPHIFETQYQQNPIPIEGLMYSNFRTYDILPVGQGVAKNYTDTADTGADFLCSICYVEYPQGLYITDVVYTKRPMEYTEVAVAQMLERNQTKEANIESNNGGRGFARNVERNLREMGNRTTTVRWFHQSENKAGRILTNSATVQNMVFFPSDWDRRFPQFFEALTSYHKEGRNAHDDAPDAVTGMIEKMGTSRGLRGVVRRN